MISLRLMEDTMEDYIAMRNWFLEPELQRWVWCDEKGEPPVPLERIIEKYGSRVKNPTDVFPYFILRDSEPIGFIQYYIQDETTIGLDMWIGILKERNSGYGTEALKQMVELIHKKHPYIKELFIDPEMENIRAVKCYQKAGFKNCGEIVDEEGDKCLMMKVIFEEEYWDLYDENRNLLGRTIKRGDAFGEGEYHVACEMWVRGTDEKFLVTKRHPNKKAGGLWEFTGGGVLAGESSKQAAVRELKEEIGVAVEESDLKLLETYQHKNYFMDIFVVEKDVKLEDLVLQPEEVVDAKWVSAEELSEMIEAGEVVYSVGLRYKQYQELLS